MVDMMDTKEYKPYISLILMLSGFGKRFGGNKLLANIHGEPLYQIALKLAAESTADHVVVVTRYEEIAAYCRLHHPTMQIIWNEHPERGISESIKLGIREGSGSPDGCCFLVGDQPFLRNTTIWKLLTAFRESPDKIYLLSDGIRRGNPVLFPSFCFQELMGLEGDHGGKSILKNYPKQIWEIMVEEVEELFDIDIRKDIRETDSPVAK